MRQLRSGKDGGATAAQVHKLEDKVQRKQRQISENLRKNRDSYWTDVAERLETAYASNDMKLYYKLIKEAHGPQLAITSKGRQSLTGQHMRWKEDEDRAGDKMGRTLHRTVQPAGNIRRHSTHVPLSSTSPQWEDKNGTIRHRGAAWSDKGHEQ